MHPGVGDYHGLSETFATVKRGSQQVCVYAIDTGPGDNVLFGCKTVTIGDPPPRPATQPPAAQPPVGQPAPPGATLTTPIESRSVTFPKTVEHRRKLWLTCTGVPDGTHLKVRFTRKHRKPVVRAARVRSGVAKVKPPRRKGRYRVWISLGGAKIASGVIRVR